MPEEAHITLYDIIKCGYHYRGRDIPAFGGLHDTLAQLKDWAFRADRPLAETCTYEVEDTDSVLRTFCFDIAESENNDFLLVTWNETETIDGSMASVNGRDPAGQAHVNTNEVPPGHIAGYPTYFWLIPEHNVFAAIRFGNRANGHSGLKRLLTEFLQKFTSYVVYGEPDDTGNNQLLGYRRTPKQEFESVFPMFKTALKKLPGEIDYIRQNRGRIKNVIRKNALTPANHDDRALWQRLLNNIGIIQAPPITGETKIKAEFSYCPSEDELEEIINAWEENIGVKWANIGFELQGETEIKWLSHSLVKERRELDVRRNADGIITAESLLNEINIYRQQILELNRQI